MAKLGFRPSPIKLQICLFTRPQCLFNNPVHFIIDSTGTPKLKKKKGKRSFVRQNRLLSPPQLSQYSFINIVSSNNNVEEGNSRQRNYVTTFMFFMFLFFLDNSFLKKVNCLSMQMNCLSASTMICAGELRVCSLN